MAISGVLQLAASTLGTLCLLPSEQNPGRYRPHFFEDGAYAHFIHHRQPDHAAAGT